MTLSETVVAVLIVALCLSIFFAIDQSSLATIQHDEHEQNAIVWANSELHRLSRDVWLHTNYRLKDSLQSDGVPMFLTMDIRALTKQTDRVQAACHYESDTRWYSFSLSKTVYHYVQ